MDYSTFEITIEWPTVDDGSDSSRSQYFEQETIPGALYAVKLENSYQTLENYKEKNALRRLFEGYMKDPIFRE